MFYQLTMKGLPPSGERPFLRHDKSLHPKVKALNPVIPLNYIFQIEAFNLSHYSAAMVTLLLVLSAVTFQPVVEASTC